MADLRGLFDERDCDGGDEEGSENEGFVFYRHAFGSD
jgi:hypothetical protein